MRQITLSFRDETIVSLHRDFEAFVRLSLKFDPHFITPSFEDFLRAKLLDNPTPLTEQAVQRMLQNSLALAVLEGQFKEGDIIVAEAGEGDALRFRHGDGSEVDAANPSAVPAATAGTA